MKLAIIAAVWGFAACNYIKNIYKSQEKVTDGGSLWKDLKLNYYASDYPTSENTLAACMANKDEYINYSKI